MMTDVREIFKSDWEKYCNFRPFKVTKYEWLSENVFELTTYDSSISELFGKKIVEVCRAILDRNTFKYIEKGENEYVTHILVCQVLEQFCWIEWGTSIRGAWFEEQHFNQYQSRYILRYGNDLKELPFTEENIKLLIEFVEEKENG